MPEAITENTLFYGDNLPIPGIITPILPLI